MPRNAIYAQSGGVTPVINASAAGLLLTARQYPQHIERFFAAKNGILGVLNEALIDTAVLSERELHQLKQTPSGAFGSCRHKLKTDAELKRLLAVFQAWDIGYFFYNGGGDSADTCLRVSELARAANYPLQAIHIPKTIDNDLPLTDCSPGFGSVAKYVATSVREAGLDVASMAASSTKVFVLEVMGRHAGWIAAASALASRQAGEPPHLILLPEVPFESERFITLVQDTVARYGYAVIVAAEGVKDTSGQFLSETGLRDAFGHAQLGGLAPTLVAQIKAATGFKCHWAVADYLQRAARHLASATDLAQAVAVGEAAAQLAVAGQSEVMITVERLSDKPYTWEIGAVPLAMVANVEKTMPPEFIDAQGFGITDLARRYLSPLIQGEAPPPFIDGLPDYGFWQWQLETPRLPRYSQEV
ncbi:6-phosphofructokinase [Chitinibacter bivalviorum]|uniref:Pyrophosphate--fructose 6-phosphate 1-phosphotransferase n=1 Tax=Chitinibacter bivalviorum TaxID=2739434 RepID=A0A7H9BE80_9NEIS|nr:6-phosphofructokinase [Chitinibacter bivalviorum]QLG86895.1 6-phosphofructokinase [Chitinibacter bivalviorum]